MAVDPRLLEVLICPACRGPVRTRVEPGIECVDCGRIYPIRDGIPVMLVDEAAGPTRDTGSVDGAAERA